MCGGGARQAYCGHIYIPRWSTFKRYEGILNQGKVYILKMILKKKDNKKQFFECLTSQFFSYIENFFDNLLYFNEYIALLSMFFSTINLNFS